MDCLIAPALNGTYTEGSKIAYYRRIADTPVNMPDGREILYNYATFSTWESDYRRFGFDALMPKTRSDIGSTRKLQEYHKFIEDGFIKQSEVSVSTIQRFVKRKDLKSARNLNIKDRKAFEEEFAGGMYQGDTCYGPYITENGQRRRTYLIIDNGSPYKNEQLTLICGSLGIVELHTAIRDGAYIYYENEKYPICKTNKVENGKTKRNNNFKINYSERR